MGRQEEVRSEVFRAAAPLAEELGIELVEINVHFHNQTVIIQVIADLPAGGIGLEECTALNRRLDRMLYEDLGFGENYTLEVSSPGLDRHLTTYRDLRRVVGRDVHVFLREPVRGKREIIGCLTAVRESDFLLSVRGEEWLIPMDKLDKAKQIIS